MKWMASIKAHDKLPEMDITDDYDRFKYIKGNRHLDEKWVVRLMRRMEKKDLFTPILVNEKDEIIDGQHRLEARKRLKLLIPFIVISNYGLDEVQELNSQQKKWTYDDFTDSYIERGFKDYEVYKWFKNKYQLAHGETMLLLHKTRHNDNVSMARRFQAGEFVVNDLEQAIIFADRITSLAPVYKGYKRRAFVRALVWLFKRPVFEWERFYKKAQQYKPGIPDCINKQDYVAAIEQIYNYRMSPENKISLVYAKTEEQLLSLAKAKKKSPKKVKK